MLIKHHVLRAFVGLEVQLCSFSTLALVGDECSG